MVLEIAETQWNFIPPYINLLDWSKIDMMPLFYLYFYVTWSIVWLIGMIIFFYRINETQVQMRSPILVTLSSIGAQLTLTCTTLDTLLTHEHYPCFLDLWYILSFFPLYFIPFVLRFMRYFITMKKLEDWQKGKIKDPRSSIWISEKPWINILGYLLSITMGGAVYFQFTYCSEWVSAYGCSLTNITFYILISIFSICLILVFAGLIYMKSIPDPYFLKSELVTCFTLWILTLGPYIIFYKQSPETRDKISYLMYFFIIGGYFTSVLWPIYLTYKHPPEQSTPEKILDSVEQITLDQEGYKLIEQVAHQYHASEMPPLLREILMFKELSDQREIVNRSNYIYNEFIKNGAKRQNNFSAIMVNDIESRLSNPTNDIFNGPYREILKLFKTNFLRAVKNLPAYTELVKKREDEINSQRMQHEIFQRNK